MLSQIVAGEIRAELGRQSVSRKAFASAVNLPYKRALQMLDGQRPWTLEDVERAARALDVKAMDLLFPSTPAEAAA